MGRRRLLAGGTAVLGALLLAGCQTPAVRRDRALVLAGRPPIRLNVAAMEILDPPPPADPAIHVQDQMPQRPAQVLRGWLAQRLLPVGASGTARLAIEEASVLEEALALTPGLRGRFTLDQSERYTLTYRVRLDVAHASTGVSGTATAEAIRSTTMREDVTLAQRESAWFDLIEAAIADLDQVLEQNIRTYLPAFLV